MNFSDERFISKKRKRLLYAIAHVWLILISVQGLAAEPSYYPGSTRKMFQLTGDYDQPLRKNTQTLTHTTAGVISTDLGSSFEHKGKLHFLFGDTFGANGTKDRDFLAFTDALTPDELDLDFHLGTDGYFQRIAIPDTSQGAYEVPSYGVSIGENIYIVHTTNWNAQTSNMERSVLACSEDDGVTWRRVYTLSTAVNNDMTNAHFINVSLATVAAEDYPGELPYSTGEVVLIWGSGAYRASNVYLACVPSSQIEVRSALRYLSGFTAEDVPIWSDNESDSVPLFSHPCVGEFSTAWIETLQRWLILYNASLPRGITMRTASKPWGPFSTGKVILDPWRDSAYGKYLHVPWNWVRMDAFHDSGRSNDWGGEYGPYIIPRFTHGTAQQCFIYYTLSTWNPYQTVLMRSTVGEPVPLSTATENVKLMPGGDGWINSSPDFFVPLTIVGKPYISTYNSQGDAGTGVTWTWLPRDKRNRQLALEVTGGRAEVILIEGGDEIPASVPAADLYPRIKSGEFGDVVQCSWGHDSNDIRIGVTWALSAFDSANLKVVVIDHLPAAPWGFVSVSEMTLTRAVEEPATPTQTPSMTYTPTDTPTNETPTLTPTSTTTATSTRSPTTTHTPTATDTWTHTPTLTDPPTQTPSETPTSSPSFTPTDSPSSTPSETPSRTPSNTPTSTDSPTFTPSATPTSDASRFDLNGDGEVDVRDLLILVHSFDTDNEQADFNDDGVVDSKDLFLFCQHWARSGHQVSD